MSTEIAESYSPPEKASTQENFRQRRTVCSENYRPHIKNGHDFGHYLENILEGKDHSILGDKLKYNGIIRLYKKQCNGLCLNQFLPKVYETYLNNVKDKILEWEVPDARHKTNAERIAAKAQRELERALANGKANHEITKINVNPDTLATIKEYHPTTKYGKLFKKWIENKYMDGKHDIPKGDQHRFVTQVKYYNQYLNDNKKIPIWISKDQLNYLESIKDKIKTWNIEPVIRRAETKFDNVHDIFKPKSANCIDFKSYVENLLTGTNKNNVHGDESRYRTQIRAYINAKKTKSSSFTCWISLEQQKYLDSIQDQILNFNMPRFVYKGKPIYDDKSKTNNSYQNAYNKLLGKEGTTLDRFKQLVQSYIEKKPIKVDRCDGNMQTQLKQFCRHMHDKKFVISTYTPKAHKEYLESIKDSLSDIDWKTIGPRPGGDTSLTRTAALNASRSQKMKEYWAKKRGQDISVKLSSIQANAIEEKFKEQDPIVLGPIPTKLDADLLDNAKPYRTPKQKKVDEILRLNEIANVHLPSTNVLLKLGSDQLVAIIKDLRSKVERQSIDASTIKSTSELSQEIVKQAKSLNIDITTDSLNDIRSCIRTIQLLLSLIETNQAEINRVQTNLETNKIIADKEKECAVSEARSSYNNMVRSLQEEVLALRKLVVTSGQGDSKSNIKTDTQSTNLNINQQPVYIDTFATFVNVIKQSGLKQFHMEF